MVVTSFSFGGILNSSRRPRPLKQSNEARVADSEGSRGYGTTYFLLYLNTLSMKESDGVATEFLWILFFWRT